MAATNGQTAEGRARMDEARRIAAEDAALRPVLPPSNGTATSDAAAESMIVPAAELRAAVYRLVVDAGAHGTTCDEAEVRLGRSHQSVSARFRELVVDGRIAIAPATRATRSGRQARVYVRSA